MEDSSDEEPKREQPVAPQPMRIMSDSVPRESLMLNEESPKDQPEELTPIDTRAENTAPPLRTSNPSFCLIEPTVLPEFNKLKDSKFRRNRTVTLGQEPARESEIFKRNSLQEVDASDPVDDRYLEQIKQVQEHTLSAVSEEESMAERTSCGAMTFKSHFRLTRAQGITSMNVGDISLEQESVHGDSSLSRNSTTNLNNSGVALGDGSFKLNRSVSLKSKVYSMGITGDGSHNIKCSDSSKNRVHQMMIVESPAERVDDSNSSSSIS